MKRIVLLVSIIFLSFGCSSDDDNANNGLKMFYNQTYCADPWGYGDNDIELASKIKTFFAETTIEISNLAFDTKGNQQVCNACSCWSGKRIIVAVDPDDMDAIEAYGFQTFN